MVYQTILYNGVRPTTTNLIVCVTCIDDKGKVIPNKESILIYFGISHTNEDFSIGIHARIYGREEGINVLRVIITVILQLWTACFEVIPHYFTCLR